MTRDFIKSVDASTAATGGQPWLPPSPDICCYCLEKPATIYYSLCHTEPYPGYQPYCSGCCEELALGMLRDVAAVEFGEEKTQPWYLKLRDGWRKGCGPLMTTADKLNDALYTTSGPEALLRSLTLTELFAAYREAKADGSDKGQQCARHFSREIMRRQLPRGDPHITEPVAELLFAIEAALPFVEAVAGHPALCSSSGGPVALKALLAKYHWNAERWKWNGCGP